MSELIKTTVSYYETGPELLNKRRPITLQVQANTNQSATNKQYNIIRTSLDCGRDNPFRPGGAIYKSADPIVDYYKISGNLNSRPQSPTESQKQLDILLGRVKEAERATNKQTETESKNAAKEQHVSCLRKVFCCYCFCPDRRKRIKNCDSHQCKHESPINEQIKTNGCDKLISTSEIDHFNVKSSLRPQRDASVASSNQQNNNNKHNNTNKHLIRADSSSLSVASSSAKLSFKPTTHVTELRFDDSSFSSASIIDPSNKSQSLNQEKSLNGNAGFVDQLNRNNSDESQERTTQRQRNVKLHNDQQEFMVHRRPIINVDSISSERPSISDDSDRARKMFEQAKGEIGKRQNKSRNDGHQSKPKNASCVIS